MEDVEAPVLMYGCGGPPGAGVPAFAPALYGTDPFRMPSLYWSTGTPGHERRLLSVPSIGSTMTCADA